MSVNLLDLTSGHVKVLGNRGDVHTFRLTNPTTGAVVIEEGKEYSATYTTRNGVETPVDVDMSELAEGVISFSLVVKNGVYRLYLVDPQRTLFTAEVDAR